MNVKHKLSLRRCSIPRPGFILLVFLFALVTNAQAQDKISGRVTDSESGDPLPGVNIVIKNTSLGTFTDKQGNYSLVNTTANDTLVFSFVGYQTQKVAINDRKIINISMQSAVLTGEQLVVIGYGQVQKRDLTGAVNSVTEDEFNKGIQTSPDQLIKGKVPGVKITEISGEPGAGSSIRIRGANSITAGNEPLYVIDGLPGAPFNSLNPGDIQSIEVLKDASATAIYGSRGSNGVILITTKKGSKSGFQVDYQGSYGTQQIANRLDLLNAREYATFINGLREDQGEDPLFTQQEINAAGNGTNWQDEIYRTAPVQNHQLSFSGGQENSQYYISLNYLNQDGIVIGSGLDRYSARVNVNHSEGKFDFGLNLNTSFVDDQNVPGGVGFNAAAGVIASALQYDPLTPVRDENGDFTQNQNLDLNNPVAQAETILNETQTNRTFGTIYGQYEILNNLDAKLNFGSDRRVLRSDNFISNVTKRGQSTNGSANINENEDTSYLAEFTLNYKKTFSSIHQVDVLAGYTYQVFNGRGFNAGSENFPTDAFGDNNLGAGDQDKYSVGSGRAKNQLLSYLGRVNYTLMDKYLFTANFRIDGSSRFGADNKYGYFPSAAIGWRLSDEPFLSSVHSITDLKLRAGYGITGNQEIGNYNSLVLLGTVGDAVFNGSRFVSIAPIQLANPDLKWESTRQLNIGLDYGFVNDRISGSLNYYIKNTFDLLLQLPIPNSSGFGTSLQNVGDTKNTGFEFAINTRNLVGDFSWSTNFNFSTLHNEVTNLGSLDNILLGNIRFLNDFSILREGDPINSYYGYKTDGIFQSQQEVESSAQPNANPGDIRFVDKNGDGNISPDDRQILGDPFPNLNLGLTNDFAYKGFGLNIFVEGSLGQQLLDFTRVDSENPITLRRNRQAYVLDRWTPDNPSTDTPSFLHSNVSRAINSRVVEDASYVRLKNVKLSYNLPPAILGGLRALSVYVTGQNLVTITNYTGYNPDVSVLGSNNLRIDYNAYPLPRIYTAGVNIKF